MVHKVKIKTQSEKQCPVCENNQIRIFYEVLQIPVEVNLLWPEREDALSVPKGDIRLAFCQECGHIFNTTFNTDLVKYNDWYENSLHFSSRFQSYSRPVVDRLIQRYDLKKKDVIDIGSGKTEFLELVCELGENRGIGIYPGYLDNLNQSMTQQRVMFLQNISTDQLARYQADLISCRGILERIYRPREFVGAMRRDIGDKRDAIGFIEVPNGLKRLRNRAIWEVNYQDYSYFTPRSLVTLLSNSGFDIIEQGIAKEGLLLTADIRPCVGTRGEVHKQVVDDMSAIQQEIDAFHQYFVDQTQYWKTKLEEWTAAGKKVVLWGVGQREMNFINTLKIDESILHVVDVDLHNRGLHLPGSGHRVISPAALRNLHPDIIMLVGALFESDIHQLVNAMDLNPEFVVV